MRKRIMRTTRLARQRLAERMHKRRKTLAEWQQKVVDPNEVARRMSWIWGIPVRELMPKEVSVKIDQNLAGHYFGNTHEYVVSGGWGEEQRKSTKAHEITHGLQAVLDSSDRKKWFSPRTRKLVFALGMNPKIIQKDMAEELVADAAERPEYRHMHHNISTIAKYWGGLPIITVLSLLAPLSPKVGLAGLAILGPKIIGRQIEFRAQRGSIQRLYGKHGVDGLILFMATPPKVFGAIEMRLWERRMVKQGLLEMDSGLTKAGLEFLRKHLPKKEIAGRLEEMKAKRRQMESIDRLRQRAGK